MPKLEFLYYRVWIVISHGQRQEMWSAEWDFMSIKVAELISLIICDSYY